MTEKKQEQPARQNKTQIVWRTSSNHKVSENKRQRQGCLSEVRH